jgi:hypothetical protein
MMTEMKKYCICFCMLAAICAVWTPAALGQTATGQIEGRVLDPSGAAIPQASVEVINVDTTVKRVAQSDAAGRYTVPLLQPGVYRITVRKEGFKPSQTSNITLQVNATIQEDVILSIGTVSQTIEVKARSELVQSATSELGTVVGAKASAELPLNGRNFSQLLTMVPGITPVNTAQTQSAGTGWDTTTLGVPGAAWSMPSVAGAWNRSNQHLLDGVNNSEFNDSNYVVPPIVDAIQEFKVQMHNDKAEYGGVLGGVVSVITKSGTNNLHGSAYEFVRNNWFDARNPFADEFNSGPAEFRQNQFGATVGGPVLIPKLYNGRNRSFFYFGYEGVRWTQSAQSRGYVPTASEINGDFSKSIINQNIFDPTTTAADPAHPGQYLRTQFSYGGVKNVIPPSMVDPKVQGFITAYFDRPNLPGDPVHNFILTLPNIVTENEWHVRGDEQLGTRDNLFFRWTEFDGTNLSPGYKSRGQTYVPARQIAGGWNHMFTPSLIAEGRGGFTQRPFHACSLTSVGAGPGTSLGWAAAGGSTISLASPWGGAGWSDQCSLINSPTWHGTGAVTWIHGRHNVKVGLQWLRQGNDNIGAPHGTYTYANAQTADPENPATTGASLASALVGYPTQTNVQLANSFVIRYSTWMGFAQDEFKINNKITLNYGLRLDYRRPVGSYSPQSFIAGAVPNGDYWIGLDAMPAVCGGTVVAPCLPQPLTQITNGSHIKLAPLGKQWGPATEWDDWGPRLGLAYRLNDKTVVRSGWGITYDPLTGVDQDWKGIQGSWPAASGLWMNLPWNSTFGSPLTTTEQTWGKTGTPLPTADPWSQTNWWFDPDHKDSRSQQWNVEVQRQATSNLLIAIGYVGSHTDRLDNTGLWNTATTPGAGTAAQVQARRPFPWWPSTQFMGTSSATASYNALEARLERRFANGFYYLVSYTWSKSMDLGSSGWFDAENGAGGGGVQNYYDAKSSRSVSGYDVPHFLSMSGVYELPFGKGKKYFNQHGAASWLLGNWQTNAIAQLRSGQPYTVGVSGDVANIGNTVGWFNYARPNLVGNPHISNPTSEKFFNTSAFAAPSFSYGNLGRNTMRTAPVYTADFSLFKNFPVREGFNASFRMEFFNVFNIQNYGAPDATLGDAGFGRVSSTVNAARQIQLALRLTF